MPIWGGLAILSNLLLVLFCKGGPRAFYLLSVSMLILFVVIYNRFSKPINRLQTEAAKAGRKLDNACVGGVLGPFPDDSLSAAGRIHARSVSCGASHFGVRQPVRRCALSPPTTVRNCELCLASDKRYCSDMNRRAFLKASGAAALLPLSPRGLFIGSVSRRPRPSDAGWPSKEAWKGLNDTVGGNLIPIDFPITACGSGPDSADCKKLFENLRNPYYMGDQPGVTQTLGWIDAWATKPSVYAVAARSAQDIAAGVNFARENNLRLVVKGGGHSYQGTSNAPASLLTWTRQLNKVVLHDAFVSRGCERHQKATPAVTIEAGAVWMDVYDAVTTKAGRYVQGGGCATVGVAGLIQSGGFGSMSKGFGTAAAGLLEAEIVTADGVVRMVNACMNPDLFWALKGGGGGSWGVVTRLTLRTHELPEFFGYAGGTIKAKSDAAFRRLIVRFVAFYHDELFNPHWGESVKIKPENTLDLSMVCQGLGDRQTADVWQPFFDWVKSS